MATGRTGIFKVDLPRGNHFAAEMSERHHRGVGGVHEVL